MQLHALVSNGIECREIKYCEIVKNEREVIKMTNAEIIMRERMELAEQGILATSPDTFIDVDGEEVEMEVPEEIHTFDYWKNAGRCVKYGEHAVAKFAVWSPTKASRKEQAEAEAKGEKPKMKMYMRMTSFFKRDQTETLEEAEKHREERKAAKEAEKKQAEKPETSKARHGEYEEKFEKACAEIQAENEAKKTEKKTTKKTAEKPKTKTEKKTVKKTAKPDTPNSKKEVEVGEQYAFA